VRLWKPPAERTKDRVSGRQVEGFTTASATCACCQLRQHVYQFQRRPDGARDVGTCIACKRDCRYAKTCRLGVVHRDGAAPSDPIGKRSAQAPTLALVQAWVVPPVG
jgi:hypothetical protein